MSKRAKAYGTGFIWGEYSPRSRACSGAAPLGKAANTPHIGHMTKTPEKPSTDATNPADAAKPAPETDTKKATKEIGGRGGPDPTRYGDWEKAGRCVDF
jgi:hypothetical protein